jgi:polyphosphate kinase
MGLLTCAKPIGEDATAVFNMLSGYSEPLAWNKLSLAPLWLRDRFAELIHQEEINAREGRPAHIIAKMNSLCDKGIIMALYKASAAGVKIELIIRGICCLKTGIPGISENIHVRSIVISLNIAGFSISTIMDGKMCLWEVRTGCREIWIAVWKLCFRWKMRPVKKK